MTPPAVSVVLITYNDAGRLPRALASVQRQTLRSLEIIVVDDCSTDDTAEVVAALAAEDPRIRYERLERNSGGCSAPRNRGVDLARAPWVMFCDSDDEYERHACTNLLEAAERTGADVVCGTAERVDVRTGRTRRWRPELHERERVVDALVDLPDLLYDTISVNKIYRRDLLQDNGIRFPEGLLFEDQLFTLEAMSAARRLAVVPNVVYRWSVDRLSEEPSITQRRQEERNVEDRIEINRRIDAFLDRHGDARLRVEKDVKFLRHDLYLYLSSMLEADDETARALADRLHPYVSSLDLALAWRLRPALRVAVYHLLVGDLECLRSAMRFVKWASVVDVPIVSADGRQSWGCAHLPGGPDVAGRPAADWLDVTDLGLLDIPFTQRRYLHRVTALDATGDRVVMEGSTVDYDGLLDSVTALDVRWQSGSGRVVAALAGEWTGREGDRRTWRAEGVPMAGPRPIQAADRGAVAVGLHRSSLVNATVVRAPQVAAVDLTAPGDAVLRLEPGANASLGWRTRSGGRRPSPEPGVLGRLRRGIGVRWARWWGRLLPARRRIVVDAGRRPDPDVVAVAGRLAALAPELTQVWVTRDGAGAPAGATTVERGTVRQAWAQARAAARLEGEGAEVASGLRAGSVVVALAATPVHRVGLDDPRVLVSRSGQAGVRRRGRTWTLLAVPGPAAAEVLRPAWAVRGSIVPVGLPRMDPALAATREELRHRHDLPRDRPVVLYLPLPRPAAGLDLEAWAEVLGHRAYLVVADGAEPSTRLRHAVRALGVDEDLSGVIAAADLVVSDYSPRIGDAVVADRPVVLYQPDRAVFLDRTCGLYPGLEQVGPVVLDQPGLRREVDRWMADPAAWQAEWAAGRGAWADAWVGPRDPGAAGRAARAILDAVGAVR